MLPSTYTHAHVYTKCVDTCGIMVGGTTSVHCWTYLKFPLCICSSHREKAIHCRQRLVGSHDMHMTCTRHGITSKCLHNSYTSSTPASTHYTNPRFVHTHTLWMQCTIYSVLFDFTTAALRRRAKPIATVHMKMPL